MKSMLFLVILALVPFNQVCGDFLSTQFGIQDNWRPPFKGQVTKGFKNAHGKALGISNFRPGDKHSLDHVYSWLSIRASVNDEVRKAFTAQLGPGPKAALNALAAEIFEIDPNAVVNLDYYKKTSSSKSHVLYLRSGSVVGTQNLENVNANMLNEAMQHIQNLNFIGNNILTVLANKNANANEIVKLLRILNSAPANLRYGDSRTNGSIQDFVDLMGDKNGKPTPKELKLVKLGLQSPTVQSIIKPETCNGVGGSCIKSSTGTILNPKTTSGYYYMKCPSNLCQ